MTHTRYEPSGESGVDIEALRRRLIGELEAAYFSGLGPASLEISDVMRADDDELIRLAAQWGVL